MSENKLNLALIFGGKSLEHEVSIVTTLQASQWINPRKYNLYLIYLDQNNYPYLCPSCQKIPPRLFIQKTFEQNRKIQFINQGIVVGEGLFRKKIKIDVAFLSLHGAFGEDGKLQGMLELLNIPYTSCGVLGSALGMDKIITKKIFKEMGLPVTPFKWFYAADFKEKPQLFLDQINQNLKYPLFVKPANAGSSIGVKKVKTPTQLKEVIKKTMEIDRKILVEESVEETVDINCSVLGGYEPIVSVCEQPLSEGELLSFKEKYLKGGKTKGMAGLCRIVPAPIPDKIAIKIQEMAKAIFKEFDCWGVIRVDFLYQKKTGKVFANEINTIPGSHAYYLWQKADLKPEELVDKLVALAFEKQKEKENLNFVFKSKILDQK